MVDIMKQLPLDSPLWKTFEVFGGRPERIPFLLEKLTSDSTDPNDPSMNELVSAIFHQYSLTDATYAVFPYLAQISDRFSVTNPALFYLAANIAAVAEIGLPDIQADIYEGFREGLLSLEMRAISRILQTKLDFRELYRECISAMAFSGNCCGRLLMDGLEKEGTRNTGLICKNCDLPIEVMLFEEGLAVIESGQRTNAPNPSNPIPEPPTNSYDARHQNPWNNVYSLISEKALLLRLSDAESQHVEMAMRVCAAGLGPGTPPADAFSLLGSILLVHGFPNSARRFFHLWDVVTCPKCTFTFTAAEGWWGCTGAL